MRSTVKYSDNTGRPGPTITFKKILSEKIEEKTLYYCRGVLLITKKKKEEEG